MIVDDLAGQVVGQLAELLVEGGSVRCGHGSHRGLRRMGHLTSGPARAIDHVSEECAFPVEQFVQFFVKGQEIVGDP